MLTRCLKFFSQCVVTFVLAVMALSTNAEDLNSILNHVNQAVQQTNEILQNSQQRDGPTGANNPQNQDNYPQPQGNYPTQPSYNPPTNTPAYGNRTYDPERYQHSAQVLYEGKCHNKNSWREEPCKAETIRLSNQPDNHNQTRGYPYIDHKLDPPGTTCGWIFDKGHNVKVCLNGEGKTVFREDHGWQQDNPSAPARKFRSCAERFKAAGKSYNETDSKGQIIAKVFYDDQGEAGRYRYDRYGVVVNGNSKCPQ
jgi:hypothetical protein